MGEMDADESAMYEVKIWEARGEGVSELKMDGLLLPMMELYWIRKMRF
jgi:hypothetical protein